MLALLNLFSCLMTFGSPDDEIRVVSLAPSLTEICCALELKSQLVGRTSYCTYPPEVQSVPVIGDYMNANLELVVAARPNYVLALPEHREVVQRIRRLGIEVLTTRNWSIKDIFESIEQIGNRLQRQEQARALVGSLRAQVRALEVVRPVRPRCMVTIGRNGGVRGIREVFVVGRNGFMQEIIELSGGVNAFKQTTPYFPKLSQETIIEMNPDVIIELIPEVISEQEQMALRRDWDDVPQLNAVKNDRIFQIIDQASMVPGPRFVETLKRIVYILDRANELSERP